VPSPEPTLYLDREKAQFLRPLGARGRYILLAAGSLLAAALLAQRHFERPPIPDRPLRIGFEHNPPYQFRGPDGMPSGLVVEIVAEAGRRARLPLVWTETTLGSERALRSGVVDLWPLITDLPDRRRFIHISAPYLQNQHVLVLPARQPLPGPDFDGSVAHTTQAIHRRLLRAQFPGTRSLETREEVQAIAKVCAGEAAAAFLESRTALALLRKPPSGCDAAALRAHVLPGVFQLGVGATFEAAGAADRIREQIPALARDGTLATVLARYSFFGPSDTRAAYDLLEAQEENRRLLLVIGGLAAALLAASWLAWSLRRARRTAMAAEARWRTLVDTAPDLIASVDRAGRVEFVSGSASDRTRALVGRPVEELAEPARQKELAAAVREALRGESPEQIEVPGWNRSGEPTWYAIRVAPVVANGHVASATLIATDVAKRKRIEAEREELIRELEARNSELERFSYTVSHDLKSPLITIRGYLDQLERTLDAGDTVRFREDVARIAGAQQKMARLLDDLLQLSRIGRIVSAPEDVPLRELVLEARDLVEGRLAERAVAVHVEDALPVVRGDRQRLLEVVQNLIENAAKFMGAQPAPRIEIGARSDGGRPVFYVRDNGMGIPPEHHGKVFGLFEKLDATSEGTGIGLAMASRIVEAHGGRIWAESEGRGYGTTFCFTLNEARSP
jgi:PAS domain S-box-containing protein